MKRMMLLTAVCVLAVPMARADVAGKPGPAPTPNGKGKLVVMLDENARSPRLIVPRQFLAPADNKRSDAGSILPTVMSGLALALAFAGTGIWVVRQRRGGQAATLGLVACLAVLALSASLLADFAPSPRVPEQRAAFDATTIIVVEKGDAIQLFISPADLAKMQAKK
jgi:hypothetical protein